MRRTQSLELSGAYYIKFPPPCGRSFAKIAKRIATLCLLPWEGLTLPLFHIAKSALKSYAEIQKSFRLDTIRYQSKITAAAINMSTSRPIRKNTRTVLPTFRHKLRRRMTCRNSSIV